MKIVIFSLILPVAILSFLPERALAPPTMIEIVGEVSLISVGDDAITGDPWGWVRVGNSNLGNTSEDNDSTNPGSNGGDGDIRF